MAKNIYSVIITVKNDAEALQTLLTDLEEQTHLPDEVVITVAMSEDTSLKVAKKWHPKKIKTKVLEIAAHATRSEGRNLGVESSSGNILCFTDAGCRLSASWLENFAEAFSLPETKLISGYTTAIQETPLQEIQGFFTLVSRNKIGKHPLPATRNMAVRREVFESVGPFKAELNYAEDYEWSRRARSQGILSTFVPDAVVEWQPRQTWGTFWKMIFLLTRGDMQAKTWRLGHLTMWLRYVIFILFSRMAWEATENIFLASAVFLVVWLAYVGFKMLRTRFTHPRSYLFFIWAHAVVDSAVITGMIVGLYQVWQDMKQKRRARHA